MQFSSLGSSKMEISETDFFYISTIQNDQICYVKHVLAPLYVFFTLFGCCWGGGWHPRGLEHNLLMQFSNLGSSRMVVPLPSSRCLAEGNRILCSGAFGANIHYYTTQRARHTHISTPAPPSFGGRRPPPPALEQFSGRPVLTFRHFAGPIRSKYKATGSHTAPEVHFPVVGSPLFFPRERVDAARVYFLGWIGGYFASISPSPDPPFVRIWVLGVGVRCPRPSLWCRWYPPPPHPSFVLTQACPNTATPCFRTFGSFLGPSFLQFQSNGECGL